MAGKKSGKYVAAAEGEKAEKRETKTEGGDEQR